MDPDHRRRRGSSAAFRPNAGCDLEESSRPCSLFPFPRWAPTGLPCRPIIFSTCLVPCRCNSCSHQWRRWRLPRRNMNGNNCCTDKEQGTYKIGGIASERSTLNSITALSLPFFHGVGTDRFNPMRPYPIFSPRPSRGQTGETRVYRGRAMPPGASVQTGGGGPTSTVGAPG